MEELMENNPGTSDHATLAEKFNVDESRVDWHDKTLWFVREKRDKAAWQLPEWEQLRERASQIKNNVLSSLYEYLIEFERNAKNNGVTVHWAETPEDHNEIVRSIIAQHNVTRWLVCQLDYPFTEIGIHHINPIFK